MDETGTWRTPPPLERLPTEVPGLDRVLGGGLLTGDAYLLAGPPGSGKTTLGNQLAYRHAAAGRTAIVATVLTETHDRVLAHLQGFAFFDPGLVGRRVHYLNVQAELEAGGLDGVRSVLRQSVRDLGATLLILDGAAILESYGTAADYRGLIHHLQAHLALLGCTTVLLANRPPDRIDEVGTHVDGIVLVRYDPVGVRTTRSVEVAKLRGGAHLGGRHPFAVTAEGIVVSPRIEAALADAPAPLEPGGERLGFGVPGLDAMLGGGLLAGSSSILVGNPGVGKTLGAIHLLLAGAERGERGLFAGFHEGPARLVVTAAAVGLDLAGAVDAGLVRILWRSPLELAPDAWAWELMAAVAEHRPRRLVVDALTDVHRHVRPPERASDYVAALANRLRDDGVTSLLIVELDTLVGQELRVPLPAVSAAMDNVLLLRTVELGARLQRLVSVLKSRQTAYDPAMYGFTIGAGGLRVGDVFPDAAPLLTGAAVPFRRGGAGTEPGAGDAP